MTQLICNKNTVEQSSSSNVDDLDEHTVHCCCRGPLLDGNREAFAWALDSMATSTAFAATGAFLAPALLKLAKAEAGCETEAVDNKVPDCDNRVHGMKPSSLISFYATVIGLVACVLLPVAGAIVDTTPHRLVIGRVVATIYCLTVLPTIFVNEDNWFAISIVFALFGFVGWFETMLLYSYLPELSDDEERLIRYTRTFTVSSFTCMVLFLGLVAGISAGALFPNDKSSFDDEIGTAMLSQSAVFFLNIVLLYVSWGLLFQPRQPSRSLRDNEALWTSGFLQLARTAHQVRRHYHSLKWYLLSICLCDAGTHALLVLSITFLTDQLEFSGSELGAVIIVLLLASIPGGILASSVSKCWDPLSSTILSITLLILSTSLVAGLLKGPDDKTLAFVLSGLGGVGTGWKFTCDRLLFARLIPPGQNAELSGLFIFCRQCLTWLPPLVFTILNENGISQRWGVASLNIFFVLGWCGYFLGVSNYDDAVENAHRVVDVEHAES